MTIGSALIKVDEASSLQCLSRAPVLALSTTPGLLM